MIIGIDHVQLAMPHGGETHARPFWVDLMGLAEVAKPAHPALLVDDLDTLVLQLERAGVPFKAGKPLEGYVRGDIADPFGNRIELMQRV
ncbi:MAG: VOC family protein [Pseudomonadota bacterium]|nr:VOC family protein [Pseudomonadota bacterium]